MRTNSVRSVFYCVLLLGAVVTLYILFQVPIFKWSTKDRLHRLEREYVRTDLSEQERVDLTVVMDEVQLNERVQEAFRIRAQLGGAALFVLLVISNVVALKTIKNRYDRHRPPASTGV